MAATPIFTRRRGHAAGHPVELRFVDMLLIIIATLMFVAVVLSVTSAFSNNSPIERRHQATPEVTTRAAPAAIIGQPYELALAARGGDGTYTWALVQGTLPEGLGLSPNGVVQGIPARQQSSSITVRVTDGEKNVAMANLVVNVRPGGRQTGAPPAPRIVGRTVLLDDAVAGRDYRHAFSAEAGTPPYHWRLSGAAPRGLRFAPDGTLAGRPAEPGTASFTVVLTDDGNVTARENIRMIVKNAPGSLFRRMLGWLKTAITWYGYVLVAFAALFWVIGTPPTEGRPPVWQRLFQRG